MKIDSKPFVLLLLLLPLAGCERSDTLPTSAMLQEEDLSGNAAMYSKAAKDDPVIQRITAHVNEANARMEASGSGLRLGFPWLFRVGPGTDPFGSLRTGARWVKAAPEYVIDESDYSTDVTAADQDAALAGSFQSWNDVARTYIAATRMPDDVGANPDVLDGTFVGGECDDIFDVASPAVDLAAGTINPTTDILVGGWLGPDYFELCLGSADILGATWTFFGPDTNGDGYADVLYVEQFYNDGFDWTTTDSEYLDFSPNAEMDIETIAAHENGHALGLGHFGGPVNRQPFTLKPNGRVFNPEALMNPFYLGGEKRSPLPPDVAGLTTLYTGHVSTTQ